MKNKEKLKKIIYFGLASLIIIAFCIFGIVTNHKNNNNIDVENIVGSYDDINLDGLKSKIDNKEDFVLLIGFPGCQACEEYSPTFKRAQAMYEFKAYYMNINSVDNKSKTWKEIMKGITVKQKIAFSDDDDTIEDTIGNIILERKYTPVTLIYSEGNCIEGNIGNLTPDQLDNLLTRAGL